MLLCDFIGAELDTLRGHLMMPLLSTTILKILQDRLLKAKLSTSEVFSVLSHQGALVYPDSLITSEPVKKMNDIYKHFKLKCPEEIPYTLTADEYARLSGGSAGIVGTIRNVGRGGCYAPYFVVSGERKWYNQIRKFRLMEVKK